MSDPYADWDAAYVLGALSRAERREYEDHVDDCARCAAALAELGMLPGLLRLVPAGEAAASLQAEPAPPAAPAALPTPQPRRRRRRALAAAAVAAVLAAGAATAVVVTGDDPAAPPSGQTVALAGVAATPLRASVRLTPTAWGTAVAMTCTYPGGYGDRQRYALYVVGADGRRQLVSRWQAGPGDVARTHGSTDLAPAAIDRLELRDDDGTLLLARSL